MIITIVYPQKNKPVELRVPDTGEFVQVLHDFQTAHWEYKPRAETIGYKPSINPDGAFPDTFRISSLTAGDDITIPLNRDWQMYWYSLLNKATYNQIPDAKLKERWAEITEHGRALTDNTAVQQGYADYILGLNVGAKPIRQKMLTMGGNILRVLAVTSTHYEIETLDLRQPVTDVWGKWWLINWGTQTNIYSKVTDWGQLNWNQIGYGVPFLVVSDTGRAKIPKALCRPIQNGVTYTPYK
jgi:hypothetical protein